MKLSLFKIVIFLSLSAFSFLKANPDRTRPNIILIMVDDMGYSDIGCYGGEVKTPNLDKIAENGLRFKQFYNTAKCHTTRAELLTGNYAYSVGDHNMEHGATFGSIERGRLSDSDIWQVASASLANDPRIRSLLWTCGWVL